MSMTPPSSGAYPGANDREASHFSQPSRNPEDEFYRTGPQGKRNRGWDVLRSTGLTGFRAFQFSTEAHVYRINARRPDCDSFGSVAARNGRSKNHRLPSFRPHCRGVTGKNSRCCRRMETAVPEGIYGTCCESDV